jgi:hypothetical protein
VPNLAHAVENGGAYDVLWCPFARLVWLARLYAK